MYVLMDSCSAIALYYYFVISGLWYRRMLSGTLGVRGHLLFSIVV